MSFRSGVFTAFLCTQLLILPTASADASDIVQASTPQEIINAILGANSSGRTTEIQVAPGDYQFIETFDSDDGPGFLPPITGTVLLIGKKPDTTRFIRNDGALIARFINVRENGTLNVRGISLIGGFGGLGCDSSSPQPPSSCPDGGGAALNAGGVLRFEDSVLSGNEAFNFGQTSFGGAILSTSGHLDVTNTTVSGNRSTRIGGGIAVLGGTATLLNSVISGNKVSAGNAPKGATLVGFGLYIENAEVSIDHSTVSANTNANAQDAFASILHGLGIFNASGTVSIRNSAVIGNAETGVAPGAGGGVYNGGTMSIADSTVAGNAAGTFGGGIANFGQLTLQSVTVARNQVAGVARDDLNRIPYPPTCHFDPPADFGRGCAAGGGGIWNDNASLATTTMLSTAVALNTQTNIPHAGTFGPDCGGAIISSGYNAVGVVTGCETHRLGSSTPAASDQLGIDTQLGDVTDNGEPGNAHVPILSGSPLIDAGGSACAGRDQLGAPRTDGDHDGLVECDVGAVEFGPSPDGSTLTVTQSQAGGTLVTSAGTWNFGMASNAYGNAVLLNGGGTGGWATLLEVANSGQLYAQAGDGSWWRFNSPGWSVSTAPSGGQVSPDGSALTFTQSQAGATLVTSAGTWNFGTASNVYGNAVLLNGGGTDGWATLLKVANGGQLYAQAGDGSWWRWNNPGWSFSAVP